MALALVLKIYCLKNVKYYNSNIKNITPNLFCVSQRNKLT